MSGFKDHFSAIAGAYARHRPTYPPELAAHLADASRRHRLALDVGCGTGQLSVLLAAHFLRVRATDASREQIDHAEAHAGVEYVCEPAERMDVADGCADLVVAAQAAHWFDLPLFYAEVRRVAAEKAVVALVCYGVPRLPGELDGLLQEFYRRGIGGFWPPERRHVDAGYRDLPFPFEEIRSPRLTIVRSWPFSDLVGYIRTWSAVQEAERQGAAPVVVAFERRLASAWGAGRECREVIWPITMRLGRV